MTQYLIDVGKCDPCKLDSLSQTCLFYVARDGIHKLAETFLKYGCKANQIDSYGQTPLFYAAREGFLDIVKSLVEGGADADHVDADGQTPLFYAVRNGKIETLEYLVKNCSVNILKEDAKGQNLIQYAAKFKLFAVIEYLMGIGVPCAADIKRKVERNKDKFGGRQKRDEE